MFTTSDLLQNCTAWNLFIAPNNPRGETGGGDYGLFTFTRICKGDKIVDSGPFDTTHAEVCRLIGVQLDEKYGVTATPVAGRYKRHILTFLQSNKCFARCDDLGHIDNKDITWIDLAKIRSPVLMLNSVNRFDDPREPNVEFQVGTIHEGDTSYYTSYVVATTDIEAGEELLERYFLEPIDYEEGGEEEEDDHDYDDDE